MLWSEIIEFIISRSCLMYLMGRILVPASTLLHYCGYNIYRRKSDGIKITNTRSSEAAALLGEISATNKRAHVRNYIGLTW